MSDHLSPSMKGRLAPLVAPAATSGELLSAADEARAFWRVRARLAVTLLCQAFAHARLRTTVIALLSLLLWLGLFGLFAEGFHLLKRGIHHPDTHDQAVRALFGMFFAALMIMLTFSAGVILYSSLFRTREISFLLTLPARTERVFLHKFQETIVLASWGFLLLGSPILVAYGIVAGAPWYFYAMLPAFLIAFVYIPAGIGAILCLGIVHRLPGGRLYVLLAAGGALAAGALWFVWNVAAGPHGDPFTPGWFRELLGRLRFSEQRLLPSWWLSTGLLEATRNAWSESIMFLVVLIANALFCRQLAIWTAGRIYRPAFHALWGRQSARRRPKLAWIDRQLFRLTRPLPRQTRLLMAKDFRLFRRDPVQWSQFLIFLGLLALYFSNIRSFRYDSQQITWVNMVSFLNLAVVGLLMSTFATRFIFPMISLEGRRFWILGLLPLKRETILRAKFAFAVGGSIVPCCTLILLSDVMLRVPVFVLASHQLTCVVLCVGLSGIAVGLGARLPNLREESPSRIAAGFGGTLNLALSTLYILAVVLLTALPCHFYLAYHRPQAAHILFRFPSVSMWLNFWLIAGTAGSVVLGVLATVLPLKLGFRAFRKLEF